MTKKLQFDPDWLKTREDFIRIVNEMRKVRRHWDNYMFSKERNGL